MSDIDPLTAQIGVHTAAIITVAQQLLAIPSVGPSNGGAGEWAKAVALQHILHPLVDSIETYHAPDPRVPGGLRPNLVARLRGRGEGPRLWLLAHLDVVPPGPREAWASDPFTAVVREGKIFARGAEDNHQAIFSSGLLLMAYHALQRRPAGDVCLLYLSDEETGNQFGIQHVMATSQLFGPEDVIIVPDGGAADGSEIEIAEKGALRLRLTVQGKQTHASMPADGINAHRVGAHLIAALEQLYADFPTTDPLFHPSGSTFEPTIKWGNEVSFNVIPGIDQFGMDCRLLPDLPSAVVVERVRAIATQTAQRFGATAQVEVLENLVAAPATPANAPVVCALQAAVRRVHRVEPRLVGFGGRTFADYLRARGLPVAVHTKVENTLHGPNESCVIQNIVADAQVWAWVREASDV